MKLPVHISRGCRGRWNFCSFARIPVLFSLFSYCSTSTSFCFPINLCDKRASCAGGQLCKAVVGQDIHLGGVKWKGCSLARMPCIFRHQSVCVHVVCKCIFVVLNIWLSQC